MKISIINSYPSNSGDLALLEALAFGLNQHFGNVEISLHCNPKGLEVVKFLEIKSNPDLEYTLFDFDIGFKGQSKKLIKRILLKAIGRNRIIKQNILPSRLQNIYIESIQQSDIVISGPGSYLTDIYNIYDRISVLELILEMKKNLFLLSQSLGPFTKEKSLSRLANLLPRCRAIVLRERLSLVYSSPSNSYVITDICFLLARKYSFRRKDNSIITKVAVSFRFWEGLEEHKIVKVLDYLLNFRNFQVTSISTCQGIAGYVDDATYLEKLKNENAELSELVIDSSYNRPETLISKYNSFDIYVGMRLHGAILSLIGKTPAFVIGYEHKSEGIFDALGLKKYQIFHLEPFDLWKSKIEGFIKDYEDYSDRLDLLLSDASEDAMRNVTLLETLKQ